WPTSPLATAVHVPALPGKSQRLQPPTQSRSQHTPSTQKVLPQSLPALQVEPRAEPQLPVAPHTFGARQLSAPDRSTAAEPPPPWPGISQRKQAPHAGLSQHTASTQ